MEDPATPKQTPMPSFRQSLRDAARSFRSSGQSDNEAGPSNNPGSESSSSMPGAGQSSKDPGPSRTKSLASSSLADMLADRNAKRSSQDIGPSRGKLPARDILAGIDHDEQAFQTFQNPDPSFLTPPGRSLTNAIAFDSQPLSIGFPRGYGTTKSEDVDSDADLAEDVEVPPATKMVKYIPPQADPHADISATAKNSSPLFQMARDTWIFLRMIPYIPYIILPLETKEPGHEFYPSFRNIGSKTLISLVSLLELLIGLAFPVVLVLPVPAALLILGILAFSALIWLLMYPTHGPNIVMSRMDLMAREANHGERQVIGLRERKLFSDERWLFLNGVMTEGSDLQRSVDSIAKVFGRPVLGIHNKTYGLFSDILECIIQRCLSYPTRDGRIAYEAVKAGLVDPEVKRMILIAHSQGGIEAALVLDRLLTEVSHDVVSKLEIYTFGSAASHFSNPVIRRLDTPFSFKLSLPDGNPSAPLPAKYAINHIEHYANEYDMIPRWGVLYSVYKVMSKHYAGRVFVRLGASGHFFNQHYLSAMFPLDAQTASEFLDEVVTVEIELPQQREAEARRQTHKMRTRSNSKVTGFGSEALKRLWFKRWGIELGDGHHVEMPIGRLGPGEIAFLGGHAEAEAARGKTVKQLSRLWKYANGGVPDD